MVDQNHICLLKSHNCKKKKELYNTLFVSNKKSTMFAAKNIGEPKPFNEL